MKKSLAVALTLSGLMFALIAGARGDDGAEQLTRTVIQTERQAIIAANLGLSDAESAAFWPLYDEYRAAVDRVVDARVALLKEYFASYETLTDDEASRLLDDFFEYEQDLLKVRIASAKKMRKVLPGRTVARFFQIENKMDIIIEYETAGEIPLVK